MCKTGDIYDSEPECNLPVYSTGDVLDDENWTYGWLIYETTGPAIGYTSTLGHQLLAIVDTKVDDHVEIRASSDAANFITFGPDGRLDTGNPVVAVCDERNGGIHGYRISFSATGRAESVRFANLSSANRDCDP